MDRSANFAEKETSSRRFRRRRPHYQGDFPHLRKVTIVDLQIRFGEENLAAGMRVIPTHWLESIRFVTDLRQNLFQALLVSRGERK